MTQRMLIDARHREETRVAVLKGNRIEEFDFESVEHQQIKGNIYLAKVTRVEPSLQAAFVDYGGNRHGFLAFSEIHPDYYQIPKEDREALLQEEAEHAAEEARLRDTEDDFEPLDGHHDDNGQDSDLPDSDEEGEIGAPESAETLGGDAHDDHSQSDRAAAEALRTRRMNLRRRYKIQDVIHRRQVLLVQVVKEERGNKGAALTSYLSLAGRYCVLMPNTTHGGGVSRKISNVADRKRLKAIMAEMELPSSMGCIVRTAGLQRTKVEIKRDFDYLARLWDGIRETTLRSSAPALIYTDSDLVRRAIRDIYNREIDEVIVEGEHGYRAAREFMKQLMPSHVKKVKPYQDAVSLFQRYGAEDQLAAMYHPIVQLKSGGYIVINPTEALVSIDINSGRSTREHGIEATAVGTNLEAAHEIARQLRLRDMAGLVVIDFIDMEHGSNVRKVEKAMKAALGNDRARIQVGRISSFGLMEMSRQRLRTGVLEASTRQCPHCEGSGLVRTASSAGLSALRLLEEEAARGRGSKITMRASQEAAFYLLNNKRAELAEIEGRYGVVIEVLSDGEIEGARMIVDASGPPPAFTPVFEPIAIEDDFDDDTVEDEEEFAEEREDDERGDIERGERRKRVRRRRGRRDREDAPQDIQADGETAENIGDAEGENGNAENGREERGELSENGARKRNRRGRRGGRRRREGGVNAEGVRVELPEDQESADTVPEEAEPDIEAVAFDSEPPAPVEKAKRARKAKTVVVDDAELEPQQEAESDAPLTKAKRVRAKKAPVKEATTDTVTEALDSSPVPIEKPKRSRAKKAVVTETETPVALIVDDPTVVIETPAPAPVATTPVVSVPEVDVISATAEAEAPRRTGWWQRTFGDGEV